MSDHEEASRKEKKQKEDLKDDVDNAHDRKETKMKERKDDAPTKDLIIAKIIGHKINRTRKNRYTGAGEEPYFVSWNGYDTNDETCKWTWDVPRGKNLYVLLEEEYYTPGQSGGFWSMHIPLISCCLDN